MSLSESLTRLLQTLVCCLRGARSASRSKPSPKAVPGRGRSAETVDESETGSANFFGPAHARDFVFLEAVQSARMARALYEKENSAICAHVLSAPLDLFRRRVSVALASST